MAERAPSPPEVVLLDTSILTNVLRVPGFDQDAEDVWVELERLSNRDVTLLLPLVVVFETGNHIGHVRDGRERRKTAERFVSTMRRTIDGKAPWTPLRMIDLAEMASWLDGFPDAAVRGQGLGDHSIVQEWHLARDRFKQHRVRIWSTDAALQGYDRIP